MKINLEDNMRQLELGLFKDIIEKPLISFSSEIQEVLVGYMKRAIIKVVTKGEYENGKKLQSTK